MHISHFFEKMLHEQRYLATIKSYGVLLPLLLVLSGCLATPIKPSPYKMAKIRTVLVVPVESPPLKEHVDAVLEVGIDSYRIFDAQTSLQVLIKLIDPNTRQVIGRTSEKTYSVEDSPQTLLSHEAEKFKQLMTGMGAQLVASGFSGLGLPLKVSGLPVSAVDGLTP